MERKMRRTIRRMKEMAVCYSAAAARKIRMSLLAMATVYTESDPQDVDHHELINELAHKQTINDCAARIAKAKAGSQKMREH